MLPAPRGGTSFFSEEVMKKALSALVGTALFAITGAAFAQQQWSGSYSPSMPSRSSGLDNIGEEMQFVFGVDRVTALSFDRLTFSPDQGDDTTVKTTTISLFGINNQSLQGGTPSTTVPRLALDYFVAEGISVGGSLVFISSSGTQETGSQSADLPTVTNFLISPRVGYAMQFDETFSFWPRAGITYISTKADSDADTESWHGLDLTVEGMFGISPFSHFAILVGPYLDLGLSGTATSEPQGGPSTDTDAKLTGFGLTSSSVGYY